MEELGDDPAVLLVNTAFLGDVILCTPLLRALKAKYPGGALTFMGTPAGCETLRGVPFIDDLIPFDKRGGEQGRRGTIEKAGQLRERAFDLAISTHPSARAAVLLAMAGIKRRVGFATSDLPWLYHERVPRFPDVHEVERDLALLGPLGGPPAGFRPDLSLARPETGVGRDYIGNASRPRIALCPGSVWPTKRWRAAGFARVADILLDRTGGTVFIIGSREDEAAAAEVEALSSKKVANLAGKTSLKEWMGLMAGMDLIVTNDSAPTHIAGAYNVPVVVVYGPTAAGQGFYPRGPGAVVEVHDLKCRPCGRHGSKRCPEGHFKCMELISPEEVAGAAMRLLKEADNK